MHVIGTGIECADLVLQGSTGIGLLLDERFHVGDVLNCAHHCGPC